MGWGILQRKKGASRAVTGLQPHKASYTVLYSSHLNRPLSEDGWLMATGYEP